MAKLFDITGVLLAGGLSRRMGGGDKTLLDLDGRTIFEHVIERVEGQVSRLILNANGDPSRFQKFKGPIVLDSVAGNVGPLAGILSAMEWSEKNNPDCRWLASFPTDAPFIPLDFVSALSAQIDPAETDIVCAKSLNRIHPPFAIWKISLKSDLRNALVDEGVRKIDDWTGRYKVVYVDFKGDGIDPFFNINDRVSLEEARKVFQNRLKGFAKGSSNECT